MGWAGSALAVYSLLPYKTPWCVLQIDLPVFLLVGWGAGEAWRLARDPGRSRWLRATAVLAGVACLAPAPAMLGQSLADRERFDDSSRPYIYHQTFAGFDDMLQDLLGAGDQLQPHAPGGPRLVNVGLEFPLAFYTATRGWWPSRSLQLEAPPTPEQVEQAQIVLTDHALLGPVRRALAAAGGSWHEERYFHRPGIFAFVFYRRDLWERYQAAGGRAATSHPRPPLRPLPAPPR